MKATIKDVAQQAGVSVGTVSNVLNGRTGECRKDTCERVMNAVRALNYHPNRTARSLVMREARALGVTYANAGRALSSNPYIATVLDGILMATQEAGYNTVLYSGVIPGREAEAASGFLDRRVDAVCVVAPDRTNCLPQRLHAAGLPIVVIGSDAFCEGAAWVDVDNERGPRMALEHLRAAGHTRIAHFAGSEGSVAAMLRLRSFQEVGPELGLTVAPAWVVRCGFNPERTAQAARDLFASRNLPTAIFAANDEMARTIVRTAKDCGIRVPQDLSVVGFDDSRDALLSDPPLTTVRQPAYEMGFMAAQWLVNLLQKGAAPPLQQRVSPVLIDRGSVGPPRP